MKEYLLVSILGLKVYLTIITQKWCQARRVSEKEMSSALCCFGEFFFISETVTGSSLSSIHLFEAECVTEPNARMWPFLLCLLTCQNLFSFKGNGQHVQLWTIFKSIATSHTTLLWKANWIYFKSDWCGAHRSMALLWILKHVLFENSVHLKLEVLGLWW